MHIANNLICHHLAPIEPYMSARRIGGSGDTWINANELPFAGPDYQLDYSTFHRYPDHSPGQLMQAYADYAGLALNQVLATRGADEGIELLVRTFCYPGKDSLSHCPPTYGLYEISAGIHHVGVHQATLDKGFDLDVGALTQAPANTKLVFLCNPNNPTGNVFKREDILAVVECFKDRALVVVDEAYMEFSPRDSLADELAEYDNLVLLRTMSKAFGLAGVHVGFVLAHPAVIALLNKVIQPYPIAEPCAQIAIAALGPEGTARMKASVDAIDQIRSRFTEQLSRIPGVLEVYPSVTNFVLVRFEDAQMAWEKLVRAGVVARQPALNDCIRFSIANEDDMTQVIAALGPVICKG